MLYFLSDYTEGAHPKVLQHLMEQNMLHLPGYGEDECTGEAKRKVCAAFGRDDLQIQFLSGGTQTNQVVIDAVLQKYEGVLATDTAHVSTHEAGAIEYSGHKVLTIPHVNGKLRAEDLRAWLENFFNDEVWEHMVQPGMVYISNPTEFGTLYSKAELQALSQVCRQYSLPLYMDGARLGYGLVSPYNDLSVQDITEFCDIFYIGGTKQGALCGEALVFTKQNMPRRFLTSVKQHGALLAKMRVVSQQFDALFTDDLYFKISRSAIELAMEIKKAFLDKGYELLMDSPTNQQFIILPKEKLEELKQNVQFNIWQWMDDGRVAIRIATSWATTREDVEELKKLI